MGMEAENVLDRTPGRRPKRKLKVTPRRPPERTSDDIPDRKPENTLRPSDKIKGIDAGSSFKHSTSTMAAPQQF